MPNNSKRKKHPPHSKWKGYLAENGISLQEIAEILGITRTSVSHKNNGYSCYTWDEVERICNHYKISSEFFRYSSVS